MFDIVKAFHEAFHTESTWAFVIPVAALFAIMSGVLAYIIDRGYKNSVSETGQHYTDPHLAQELALESTARQAAEQENLNLKTQLDQKKKRQEIRNQIAKFINEGTNIQQECFGQVLTDDQVKENVNHWSKTVLAYLNNIEASYSARFNAASGPAYAGNQSSQTKREVWNYANIRIQALSSLLQELKD